MEAERSSLSCEYKLNSLEQAMHFIIDSLTHTGATTRKQHTSQSGVTSPRGENRLSSEPSICRTMTIGRPQQSTENPQKIQKHSFILDSQSRTIKNQKRSTGLRCTSAFPSEQIESRKQSKSVRNISSPLSPSEQKMSENYQKENNMITTCKLAELMSEEGCQRRDSSGDREGCPHHHHQPHTASSSLAPHPSKNHYHSTGHRWTFGMGLLILVIISTISTSSTVMCVPLGHQNDGGGGGSSASAEITHRNGLMMPNSRVWRLNENQLDEPTAPYSLLSKGQIYLPALLNNAPVKAAAAALASTDYSSDGASSEGGSAIKEDQQQSNHHGTSNYHLQQFHRQQNSEESPFKQSAHIQKLLSQQQKEFPLSVTSDKGMDEEEDDEDATTPTGLNEYDDDGSSTLGQSEWKTVIEPHLYVLTEWDSPPYQQQFPLLQQQRKRRNSGTGPSLSIVNPLDVLRQRLLLEIARRRMRQSHNQIIANEEILRKIGRRRR